MRSTTLLAHTMRACIVAIALLALPQLASAQLPLETKNLRIQAQTGTNAVTLTTPTAVTAYSITLPGAVGGQGSFMFANNGTGVMSWTNTPSATLTTIFYNSSTGVVEWVDPNSASNPNWSRTGNLVGGILGTTAAGQAIDFVTGAATNIRMGITATGEVNIATNATSGADVTIGNNNNDIVLNGTVDVNGNTTVDGATIALTATTSVTVTGATNINATGTAPTQIGGTGVGSSTVINGAAVNINAGAVASTTIGFTGGTITTVGALGHTGTASFTGAVTLAGLTSPLVANTGAGTGGDVLVSAGATNTPSWQNLNDAIGIRRAGNVAVTGASATGVINVPTLLATDAIVITLQGTGSTVVATVTNRTDGAPGSFTVTLSGEYTGVVNYLVIKQL